MSARNTGGSDGPSPRAVYDFLYCDVRRIGSFLSQFDESGLLKSLTQRESKSDIPNRGGKFTIGGGATLAGTGGSGSLGFERGAGGGTSDESERVYDPFWTNALGFLKILEETSLLQTKLADARLGEFVLLDGSLTIVDLSMLATLWQKPSVKKLVKGSMSSSSQDNRNRTARRSSRNARSDEGQNQADLVMDFMDILPHTAQAYLKNDNDIAWCSLGYESLVVSSGDLLLKHGPMIDGEWSVLGILDKRPDMLDPLRVQTQLSDLGLSSDGGIGFGAAVILQTASIASAMLGRVPHAYGITPLLIFRHVAKKAV